MQRQLYSTETPWEARAGYSRAVRMGAFIFVSGTTAINEAGEIQHPGDLYGQAIYIYQKIEGVLQNLGASLADVVRTRVYITDMSQWELSTRAHHQFFAAVRPANTLVEVSALATPEMLIEIEIDAMVQEATT